MAEESLTEQEKYSSIRIRYTRESDAAAMRQWFDDRDLARWFPTGEPHEIDDSVYRWIGFSRFKCSLTMEKDGVPCGIATLYLQPYRKLAHQCEFGIVVGSGYRGMGLGALLLNSLIHMAKTKFGVELLHLQVYEDNPAIRLYRRFLFKEFGRQTHWIKDHGEYVSRVFMERFI